VPLRHIVIFVVLLYSPVVIPIERFPDWAVVARIVLKRG
jgi:hypothetical protein